MTGVQTCALPIWSIAQAGISDSVTLTGAVRPAEVANWLRQMDVGVAPYPEMEPFYFSPLKIYEYQRDQQLLPGKSRKCPEYRTIQSVEPPFHPIGFESILLAHNYFLFPSIASFGGEPLYSAALKN